MKNKINQYKLLDRILSSFRTPDDKVIIVELYVNKLTAKELGISTEIHEALYDILYENGHFKKDYNNNPRITAKGILFNENEGYVRNYLLNRFYRVCAISNTIILAIGAFGLLVIEILKYRHHLLFE